MTKSRFVPVPWRPFFPPAIILLLANCATTHRMETSGMSFSSEPLVGKVVWNDLITEDLDATRRFYGGLFGWTFEHASSPGRPEYYVARSGDAYVAGLLQVPRPADGVEFSRWLPYISVEDVDAAAARASEAGGRIAVGPRDVSLGRVAAIVDPEGAVFGLARSSVGDPDDETTAPGVGRVVWTELLADETGAAAAYYHTVIGYEAHDIERRGGTYTLLEVDGRDRAGLLANPSNRASPRWLTYFGVDDPAAAARRAETLGGAIILPVSRNLRGGSMAVVTDPSGAILVLQQLQRLSGLR